MLVNFSILYKLIERLPNMNHLESHDCKGADQMKLVYNMYHRDKFLLGKENEFVMAVSIRYSTVLGKVHAGTGKLSELELKLKLKLKKVIRMLLFYQVSYILCSHQCSF